MSSASSSFPEMTPLLRKAIWEAHGRNCAYEKSPLEWDALEIDHILPKALWKNPAERKRVFASLGLPASFEVNDLTNLLPCRHIRNAQKREWLFVEDSVRFFRQVATERIPSVRGWLAKLTEEEEQERIRSNAEAASAANPALRAKLLAALTATIPLPDEEYCNDDSFRFSRSRVRLHCHLPGDSRNGSLLIQFNSLYLHAVSFTFEAREILSRLLRGWNVNPVLGQRGFMLGRAEGREDEWIVTLGGTTIFLTTDELEQLSLGLDHLAPHFLAALVRRERWDGTYAFEPEGSRNVRLFTIKRALWREIQRFADEHDYDKGSSPWHIFDAGGFGHIKIVRRTPSEGVIPFEAYIYTISPEKETHGAMIEPEDEVCLCWDADLSCLNRHSGDETKAPGWSAVKTAEWVRTKLIPEIVRRSTKPSLLDRFRQYSGLKEPPVYVNETYGVPARLLSPPVSWSEIVEFTGAAQILYIEHSHEPATRTVVESALAGLVLLADTLSVPGDKLGYIAQKLGVFGGGNLGRIVAAGRSQILGQASFTNSDVDHILRCAIAVFHSSTLADGSHPQLIHTVTAAWHPLMIAAQHEAVRHRMLDRLQHPASQ